MQTDKQMPQNLEAERALLGAVLIDSRAWYRVSLEADDFAAAAHRTIWRTVGRAMRLGDPVDLLTLRHQLEAEGELGRVGGTAYLASLTDVIPDIANVEAYAEIVAREAARRRLIRLASSMAQRAMEGAEEPSQIAADVMGHLAPAATEEDAQARLLFDVLRDEFDAAEARLTADDSPTMTTGWRAFDEYDVLRPTLVVVGSPSGHGKTAWLLNLATQLAERDRTVALFSLESTPAEVGWRYVSRVSGVPHSRARDWRRLDPGELPRVVDAHARAQKLPIWLARRIRTIDQISAECRRLRATRRLDAVMIDYIQLVSAGPSAPRDREERMALIAQRLLELALDVGIPVIASSQVNKDRLERTDRRLHPGDLKYASAIAESARAVVMFQRPHVDDPTADVPSCRVDFQVAKNNEGRTGDLEMHFDERLQRFGIGGCEENSCPRVARRRDARLFDGVPV